MKENMVQELALKALASLGQNPARKPAAKMSGIKDAQVRDMVLRLLKSLYDYNSQSGKNYNIKNVNNAPLLKTPKMPDMQANAPQPQQNVYNEFLKDEPDFFKGREALFQYLSNCGMNCDVEELKKIAGLVKLLEEAAIKRFCERNPQYAEFLQNANQKTLNKLENLANSGVCSTISDTPFYTANDIKKMTTDEFLKNENAINAQINEIIRTQR